MYHNISTSITTLESKLGDDKAIAKTIPFSKENCKFWQTNIKYIFSLDIKFLARVIWQILLFSFKAKSYFD